LKDQFARHENTGTYTHQVKVLINTDKQNTPSKRQKICSCSMEELTL